MFEPKKRGKILFYLVFVAWPWVGLSFNAMSGHLQLCLYHFVRLRVFVFASALHEVHTSTKDSREFSQVFSGHVHFIPSCPEAFSSYFLQRFPSLLSPQPFVSFCYFPCLLSLSKMGTNSIYLWTFQQMWLPGKLLQPNEGRKEGAKQRPIYVLVPEGTTNIKMQNHSILRKRSILAFWNQQSVPGTLANILCSPCTC